MSGLIKRSELLRILKNNEPMNWRDTDEEITERACWHWFNKIVEEADAIDAVEVVRCSQCKYWESMNNGSWMNKNRTDGCCRVLMKCRLAERYNTEKDHFCCYGKRREDNEID